MTPREYRKAAARWGWETESQLRRYLAREWGGPADPVGTIYGAAKTAAHFALALQAARKHPASNASIAKAAANAKKIQARRAAEVAWFRDQQHELALREDRERTRVALLSFKSIREWRATEAAADRPSELADYFKAVGLCFDCKGKGTVGLAWSKTCPSCGGAGGRL